AARGEPARRSHGDEARGRPAVSHQAEKPVREGGGNPFRGRPTREGAGARRRARSRSEEHTSELQSRENLVCRLLLEKKNSNSFYSYLITIGYHNISMSRFYISYKPSITNHMMRCTKFNYQWFTSVSSITNQFQAICSICDR